MILTKKDLKDYKFWFKVIAALITIVFLLESYIDGMVNINDKWAYYLPNKDGDIEFVGYDYLGKTIDYFSYFTIQSNIFVAIWFTIGAINHNKEIKGFWQSRIVSLAVVIYITITGLIFNFMLLPPIIADPDIVLGPKFWIEQMALHTVCPLMTVIYFLCFMQINEQTTIKQFFKNDFWKLLIYPLAYLIYALIRGEMLYAKFGHDAKLANNMGAYPYFFLEIHNPNALLGLHGVAWLFIAVIAILAIIIGLGSLYIFVINKRLNKKKEK